MIQQANSTIFQQVFSISGPTDIVPGTGIELQNWRYGIDPNPTIPAATGQLLDGSTGRLMDPKYRNPVTEEFNIGYQWALDPSSVVEVEYVHTLGLHENKTVNINPSIVATIGTDAAGNPIITSSPRPLHDAFVAAGVPVLGRVMVEASINRSRYDGMNFSYRRRLVNHFSLNANYTLAWARGWDVNTNGTAFRNYPHDPLNIWDSRDFGYTPNDERHHITVSGIAELPWGIQLSPILQFGSARPYDLSSSFDPLVRGSGYARPLIVPTSDPKDYSAYLPTTLGLTSGETQAAIYLCLQAGTCRQVGYDTVRGSNTFQLDVRAAKNIRWKDRYNLQLFFQAFNLTNRANFGNNYYNTPNNASFGQPAGFINPSSVTIPRAFNGEFGFRFSF